MNRKLGIVLLILLAISLLWIFKDKKKKQDVPKEQPIALLKHSKAFNQDINKVVEHYLSLKDAFIEGDTVSVKAKAAVLISAFDQIDTLELRKDTAAVFETIMATIGDMKSNTESILHQNDITEMRRDFSSLTEMMFPAFFNAIKYEGPTLYLQNCPMAFNDSEPANWISNSKEIMNPYMGKNHPKYHSGMLNCGEIKDTIKIK